MRSFAALAALAALLGAAPQEEKKRGPKNKEVQKTYAALMAEIGKENKGLKADLDAKKGDAAAKARLEKIKKSVEAASKLDYMGGEEKDVEEFKTMFEIFLDIRMKSFLEAEWKDDAAEKLNERLQSACRTCHELFREE